MRITFLLISVLLATACVFSSGCAAQNLRSEIDRLAGELEQFKSQNALSCAPKEWASAEAALQFAREDLEKRQYISCADHLSRLEKAIHSGKEFTAKCMQAQPGQKDVEKAKNPDSEKNAPSSDNP